MKPSHFIFILAIITAAYASRTHHHLVSTAVITPSVNTIKNITSLLLPSKSPLPSLSAQASIVAINTSNAKSPPQTLSEKIAQAEMDLLAAIEKEQVPETKLASFYRRYRGVSDDYMLAEFPPLTQQAFKNYHALLQNAVNEMMTAEGRGPEFFQQAASKPAPPAMIEHIRYLENVPVSASVDAFVKRVSQSREVTDNDIKQVASLCTKKWPCIERAAYTWIKNNHLLTSSQHQLIETYRTAGGI